MCIVIPQSICSTRRDTSRSPSLWGFMQRGKPPLSSQLQGPASPLAAALLALVAAALQAAAATAAALLGQVLEPAWQLQPARAWRPALRLV